MTQEEFANTLGLKGNSLSEIESGKRSLTDPMQKLLNLLHKVNLEWLQTGEGEMYENLPDGGDGPEPGTLIYDGDLLVKTVIAVENLIREQKADLPPEDRAKLIEIIYEMSLYRKHLMDTKEIRKILKLVG